MNTSRQIKRANAFREMHHDRRLLLLPNAWDAVSAKLYESEGFRAVGTTSAGIATALGYPDGEIMSLADNLAVCRRIISCLSIPVSVDIEAGYAGDIPELIETTGQVLESGAAGINIEDRFTPGCGGGQADTLVDLDKQCERIAAIRQAASGAGIPLVINARTDVILARNNVSDEALAEVVNRGNAYQEAGADCVFVPDMEILGDAQIEFLASELHAPLNLIAGMKTPSVARLEHMGVARLSFGPRAMRIALGHLRNMAREWLECGTYDLLFQPGALSYDEVNAWFGGAGSHAEQ